jgi:hypothetical protein
MEKMANLLDKLAMGIKARPVELESRSYKKSAYAKIRYCSVTRRTSIFL